MQATLSLTPVKRRQVLHAPTVGHQGTAWQCQTNFACCATRPLVVSAYGYEIAIQVLQDQFSDHLSRCDALRALPALAEWLSLGAARSSADLPWLGRVQVSLTAQSDRLGLLSAGRSTLIGSCEYSTCFRGQFQICQYLVREDLRN